MYHLVSPGRQFLARAPELFLLSRALLPTLRMELHFVFPKTDHPALALSYFFHPHTDRLTGGCLSHLGELQWTAAPMAMRFTS